jgi:tetratricopeptide (TPR) repeat protein
MSWRDGDLMTFILDFDGIAGADEVRAAIQSLCGVLHRRGTIRLLREFSEGHTATRVFLAEEHATPGDLGQERLVFKTGAGSLLRDEVARYQSFIPNARASAVFAELLAPEQMNDILPTDHRIGAIAYMSVGTPLGRADQRSLLEVASSFLRNETPFEELREILNATFSALASLCADPQTDFGFQIPRYYLEHWAPDFRVSVDAATKTGGRILLSLRRFAADQFAEQPTTDPMSAHQRAETDVSMEGVGELVVSNLRRAYLQGHRLWLHGPYADTLALEVDIGRLPPNGYAALAEARTLDLWALPKESRYQFYRQRLAESMPDSLLAHPVLILGVHRLHNPLHHLSKPLEAVSKSAGSIRMAPAHGDLHPGNVLVVGTTPVIIDFGNAEASMPLGSDSARLFGGLVRDVISHHISNTEMPDVLRCALELDNELLRDEGVLGRSCRLLRFVTEETKRIFGLTQTLWLTHLYGYSFIGLKWKGSPPQTLATFVLGATALNALLGVPDQPGVSLGTVRRVSHVDASVRQERDVQREGAAEILILVTRFSGDAQYDPTARVYEALADHVCEMLPGSPPLVRVELVADQIHAKQDAAALAKKYDASMVVWGRYDDFGIRPRYEVTRDSVLVSRAMIQLDERTREELSGRFEPYITHDLPAEISFLSLQAVGDMLSFNLNYNPALRVYRHALTLLEDPHRARALGAANIYTSMSMIYSALHRHDDALIAIETAHALEPDNVGYQLQQLVIGAAARKESEATAIDEMRNLLRVRASEPGIDLDEREALLEALGRLGSAKSMSEVAEIGMKGPYPPLATKGRGGRFNRDVMTHLVRARDHMAASQYDQVIVDANKALRINPTCVEALTVRAQALAIVDRVQEARADLNRAEKWNPRDSAIYALRASIEYFAGRYVEALGQLDLALERGLPFQRIFYVWGRIVLAMGDGEKLMSTLKEQKHTIDPDRPDVFLLRAEYFRRTGRLAEALSEANQALELPVPANHHGATYSERAEVYAAMGENELSTADLETALALCKTAAFERRRLRERLIAFDASKGSGSGVGAVGPIVTDGPAP